MSQTKEQSRLVWDLPLRLFHWLFAISVLVSWLSGKAGYDFRPFHMWLGYWMLGLIVFRFAWGFVGPRHSRFASFAPRPRRLWRYVRGLASGSVVESAGHNPLGGLMVFAMLALAAAQAISGLFLFDDITYVGPFNESVSADTAQFMDDVHHNAVNILLLLIVVHIAAVSFYARIKKQRLIRAMINGRKDASIVAPEEAIASSRIALAVVLTAMVAAFVYWLVEIAPGL